MLIEKTPIEGVFTATPQQHHDARGAFMEWFRSDEFEDQTGHPFTIAQANCSVSALGTIRGIHFAQVPPGQAKYVSVASGSIFDVIVDLRRGSDTFGQWTSVGLDSVNHTTLYIPEGMGHGFMSLVEDTVVNYLCSTPYAPGREHGINPFDPDLAIAWPKGVSYLLSPKDELAPTLAETISQKILPSYAECLAHAVRLQERA